MGILLNLRTSVLHRDVLRTRYHLGRTFARFSHLLRIAGDNRTHGSNSCISQGRWIVPRDRGSDRLLDQGDGSVIARHSVSGQPFSAVEPTALETLPSAFVMTATTMCGSGGYAKAFEGAYFSADLAQAHAEGRIGNVSADPILPLRAFVDIGGGWCQSRRVLRCGSSNGSGTKSASWINTRPSDRPLRTDPWGACRLAKIARLCERDHSPST